MDSSVAIAVNVPAKARDGSDFPLTFTINELTTAPESRRTRPRDANLRAAVDEKYVTTRMIAIGLTHHHGSEPGPPGFPSIARVGPPPGIANPISPHSRVGLVKIAKELGAERRIGASMNVIRRFNLSRKSGSR